MSISAFAFTLMNVTAKKMTHFNAFELVCFRSIGTLIFTTPYLLHHRIPILGTHKKLLFTRSLVGFISMSMFFLSLHYLPVGSAVTLRYLSPIFAAVFSIILLKEKIAPIRWLFFFIAFSGVVILKYVDIQINFIGLGFILISALFGGLVYVTINKIGDKEHSYTIVNYFMIFNVIVGGFLSLFDWTTPTKEDILPLLSLGIYGFFGQLYMTKAFQTSDVNKVAPIKYLEVIFTVMIGVSFFNETYPLFSLIGIGLIILGLILNIFYKKSKTG